ncbi:fatty acid desaturase [Paenibacillus darwinianus]|uniref:Fatty acid desaturase n=1 Tax=Paenibacillus darwinianus TaxID=1380763 RepID=A0A9W5W835_9BACL|nr:fatty acid desaturase [Paenibacillus darwinianus]EXX87139.1 fatty acid desaturase [Paenibacillus darwinianus]EXX88813.1 fatty acid desaturase [Paenibacillus darwinianus]EXX89704.1 fatty acid desaturase [Paenibacillus darwinianus]
MNQPEITQLKKHVAPYEQTDTRASIRQIVNTVGPLLLLWYAAYLSLSVSYWLTVPILLATAGFVVRTFILFHDCCHGSFFRSRLANDIIGTVTGILTLVPYQQWKRSHSIHHATSSNLDKRGIGDMWILTVEEYKASSVWRRIAYRFYRNPIVMFGLGPIAIFLIEYRFNTKGAKRKERINTYITNAGIIALYAALIGSVGWQAFLLIQAPVFFVSGLLGIWLFYVQHQFEDSYFENEQEWSYVKAAVDGSSYYKLPKLLQWMTGNIGFHHVHHLSPKVPNYNLEKAHNATPPLHQATTITIGTSLKSLRFRLWDERGQTFIGFGDMKRLSRRSGSVSEKLKRRNPGLQGK